jgi:hypothetical protein
MDAGARQARGRIVSNLGASKTFEQCLTAELTRPSCGFSNPPVFSQDLFDQALHHQELKTHYVLGRQLGLCRFSLTLLSGREPGDATCEGLSKCEFGLQRKSWRMAKRLWPDWASRCNPPFDVRFLLLCIARRHSGAGGAVVVSRVWFPNVPIWPDFA